jgi:protein gp37
MGQETGIAWTDHTLNLWWGCVEVSPGCDHCYAKTLALRWGRNVWGVHAPRHFTKSPLANLRKWDEQAQKDGVIRKVFVQSMSDIFEVLPENHPDYQRMNELREDFFLMIPECKNLVFQLLTKRVGNVAKVVPSFWHVGHWPQNAWLGISVVNQAEADREIPKLLALPAPIRFLSIEPMLGPVNLSPLSVHENGKSYHCLEGKRTWEAGFGMAHVEWTDDYHCDLPKIHWVICGGESGAKARPMNPDWVRDLRNPFLLQTVGRVGTEGRHWNR